MLKFKVIHKSIIRDGQRMVACSNHKLGRCRNTISGYYKYIDKHVSPFWKKVNCADCMKFDGRRYVSNKEERS